MTVHPFSAVARSYQHQPQPAARQAMHPKSAEGHDFFGQHEPKTAHPAGASHGHDPNTQAWISVYEDRMQRMNQATDPALKQHYQSELDVMKPTLQAMGLPIPDAAGGGGAHGHVSHCNTPSGQHPQQAGSPSAAASGSSLSDAPGMGTATQVAQALMKDLGLTKEQAAGLVGNLYHESGGMNPNINEGGALGAPRGVGGYGWAQWTGARQQAYLNFARQGGMDPGSAQANYAFLIHELTTSESSALSALKSSSTATDAATVFRTTYERAEVPADASRIAAANNILETLG